MVYQVRRGPCGAILAGFLALSITALTRAGNLEQLLGPPIPHPLCGFDRIVQRPPAFGEKRAHRTIVTKSCRVLDFNRGHGVPPNLAIDAAFRIWTTGSIVIGPDLAAQATPRCLDALSRELENRDVELESGALPEPSVADEACLVELTKRAIEAIREDPASAAVLDLQSYLDSADLKSPATARALKRLLLWLELHPASTSLSMIRVLLSEASDSTPSDELHCYLATKAFLVAPPSTWPDSVPPCPTHEIQLLAAPAEFSGIPQRAQQTRLADATLLALEDLTFRLPAAPGVPALSNQPVMVGLCRADESGHPFVAKAPWAQSPSTSVGVSTATESGWRLAAVAAVLPAPWYAAQSREWPCVLAGGFGGPSGFIAHGSEARSLGCKVCAAARVTP